MADKSKQPSESTLRASKRGKKKDDASSVASDDRPSEAAPAPAPPAQPAPDPRIDELRSDLSKHLEAMQSKQSNFEAVQSKRFDDMQKNFELLMQRLPAPAAAAPPPSPPVVPPSVAPGIVALPVLVERSAPRGRSRDRASRASSVASASSHVARSRTPPVVIDSIDLNDANPIDVQLTSWKKVIRALREPGTAPHDELLRAKSSIATRRIESWLDLCARVPNAFAAQVRHVQRELKAARDEYDRRCTSADSITPLAKWQRTADALADSAPPSPPHTAPSNPPADSPSLDTPAPERVAPSIVSNGYPSASVPSSPDSVECFQDTPAPKLAEITSHSAPRSSSGADPPVSHACSGTRRLRWPRA